MAIVTREVARFGNGNSVSVDFDDVNGGISLLRWDVPEAGTAFVIITNPPRPDITRTIQGPTSGQLAVNPNQYAFTFITKNNANSWGAPPNMEVRWSPA